MTDACWTELAGHLDGRMRGRAEAGCALAPHTTYRAGGPADLALFPVDAPDLALALGELRRRGLGFTVLGGGSNVLVSDRGVRGVVLLTAEMTALEVSGGELRAGAGVTSHQVARAALDAGLGGAEFLTRLPGSIGGACFMNARAYGGEIADVLLRAALVSAGGQQREVHLDPADFAYKRSPFQGSGEIIAEVTFGLAPGDAGTIRRRMDEIERSRNDKHELDFPSCGCVFKNDRRIGQPSGRLIEQCGLKGYRVGDAQVSAYHANFVFNLGQASAADLRQVMRHIRRTVRQQSGWDLQYEVQFLGDWE
jgi:UDP-N-acetylmuramate dehydrogenase